MSLILSQCLSSWEHEPDGMLDDHTIRGLTDDEQKMIDIFEGLAATVPAIPPAQRAATEAHVATVSPEKYDACMVAAFQNMTSTSFPRTASEFLDDLSMYMRTAIKAGH